MKKINCDIIQDLIPSYLDGICSKSTKECVEEHISECNLCKEQIEIFRSTELTDGAIEQKQIDGFKKFHNQMRRTNLFSMALLLLLVCLGTYTFCNDYNSLSTIIYYVLFPICMIGLYLFTGKKEEMKRAQKKDYMVAVLSIIDSICAICFLLSAINFVRDGKSVFFVEAAQLGPFILKVWGILFLLLIIGFVYLLLRMFKNNINTTCILYLQMMGMFLLLAYVTLLRTLTSIEKVYETFTQTTVIIGITGIIGILVFVVTRKRGN